MIEHDFWVKDGWLDSLTSKNIIVSDKSPERRSPVQHLNLSFVNGYYIMCNYGAQILLFNNTEAWYEVFCNVKNVNNIPPDLWIVALAAKQMWTMYPVGYNKGRIFTEHVDHQYLKKMIHDYHDPLSDEHKKENTKAEDSSDNEKMKEILKSGKRFFIGRVDEINKSGTDADYKSAIEGLTHIAVDEKSEVPKNCNAETMSKKQIISPYLNSNPWTHNLLGKKILIVSRFTDSFIKQIQAKFNFGLLSNGQEVSFYKTFGSSLEIVRDSISKMHFDIALIECGGLPIGDFVYSKLNKSSIVIGDHLQLWFGVMGEWWANDQNVQSLIKSRNLTFTRPSGDECLSIN
jgi:hypothetical protein